MGLGETCRTCTQHHTTFFPKGRCLEEASRPSQLLGHRARDILKNLLADKCEVGLSAAAFLGFLLSGSSAVSNYSSSRTHFLFVPSKKLRAVLMRSCSWQ